MKLKDLEPFQELENLRIDELVHLAAGVIPSLAGQQTRGRVTEIPDARTVRYYVSEGLVDPPSGQSGGAALYGYKHLIQLVLVKALQARHLPIRAIRSLVASSDTPALEDLLGQVIAGNPGRPGEAGHQRQDATLRLSLAEPGPAYRAGDSLSSAYDYLKSLAGEAAGRHASPPSASGWERHELYPGVELHIRTDAVLPSNPSFPSMLASRLRAILDTLRRSTP